MAVNIPIWNYYTDLQIKKHKTKCVIRVFERLLWDFQQELDKLNYVINYYTLEQQQQVVLLIGLSEVNQLNDLIINLHSLFNDLLKIQLVQEVDIMYKTGDTTDLFNRIYVIDYPFLDQQAITSEQEIKFTYRQILQAKFNPQNFNFYENL